MSLTEREKEIAIECIELFGVVHNGYLYLDGGLFSAGVVVDMFNDFLSRIREEQKEVGYITTDYYGDPYGVIQVSDLTDGKLFTIPPAAPCDCSELVEALNKAMPACVCANQVRRILANHAKRMKGEE